MSSLDGNSTCDELGNGGGKGVSVTTSNKKECTSCEQRIENHCKPSDDNNSSSSNLSDIGAVTKGISNISNDDVNTGSGNADINGVVNVAISADEKLFADPPPKEDCPICMLPMPHASGICGVRKTYEPCCGKTICEGCIWASAEEVVKGNLKEWCDFCRVPSSRSDKEFVKRLKKRMKLNDAGAFRRLGEAYSFGQRGLIKHSKKAFELWTKAAELGSLDAHYELARAYCYGDGVEQHAGKAIQHFELAAIGGHEFARNSLGVYEYKKGNVVRAMKHYIIGARCGNGDSLKKVCLGYKQGHVTKDDYAKTLRAYQHSCDEMKSEGRMKAREICDKMRR